MTDKSIFIDINILVYAYDQKAGEKHKKANDIVKNLWNLPVFPFISIQVLNELFVNLIRKQINFADCKRITSDYLYWNL